MIQAYKIALMLCALSVVVQVFAAMPFFGSAFMDMDYNSTINTTDGANFTYTWDPANSTYVMAYDANITNFTSNFSAYQPTGLTEPGIIEILTMFITALWNSTVYLPFYLNNLGVPTAWALIITCPVWFVYGAGLFQIVRGLVIE